MMKKIICMCVAVLMATTVCVSAEESFANVAKDATVYVNGTVTGEANDLTDGDESTFWQGSATAQISYRYIRIIKNTNEDGRNLGVRELTVNGTHATTGESMNLSLGKTASGAYSWTGISPGLAVDGNDQSGGWFNQYCGTHPLYLQVDLGADYKNYYIESVDFTLFNPHFASDGGDTNVRVELANSTDFKDALVLYSNLTKEKIEGKQMVTVSEGCVLIDENGRTVTPVETEKPEVSFSFGVPKKLESIAIIPADGAEIAFEVIGVPINESIGQETIYQTEELASGQVDISLEGKSYSEIKIASLSGDVPLSISEVKLMSDARLVGLFNVSLGKSVSGGENAFGVNPKCLVDGDLTNIAAAQSGNTAIDVDLGRRYPITYVELVTASTTNGGLPTRCMVYASNTPDFAEGSDTVLLHTFEEAMGGRKVYSFFGNGEAYRYIRFTDATKNTFIAMAEMSVYSACEESIGEWNVSGGAFSVNIENKSAEMKPYTMLVYQADASGEIKNIEAAAAGIAKKGSLSVNASFADENTQAILIDDLRSFNLLRASYGSPTEDEVPTVYEKEFVISCAGEEFVSVSVLKPNSAGIKNFSGVTVYNVKDVLYSVHTYDVAPGTDSIRHTFKVCEGAQTGVYTIRIKSGETENYYYYHYMDKEAEEGYLKDIFETDTPKDMLIAYAEEHLVILSPDEIEAVSNFDELFRSIRSEMYPEGFASFDEVTKAVEYVLAIDTLQKGDATEIKAFLDVSSNVFGENQYPELDEELKELVAEKIAEIREEKIATVQEAESLLQAGIALTLIENGNVAEKAEALEAYSEILGIDLEKAKELGLSTIDVAKEIKGATLDEIQAYFDEIIQEAEDAAKEEEEEDSSDDTPARPSRPSGGGGGGMSFPSKPKTEEKPEEVQPEKPPYVPVFFDVEENMWARPYIEALANNGIVSGDNTGAFRPNDPVTRAEFVKMLALAFDLKMRGDEKAFDDSTKEDWYYSYVVAAFNSGIVKGKSDIYFGAAEHITREDIAVMVQRALYLTSKDGNLPFTDYAEISDYAKGAVYDLTEKGIVSGFEDNTFRPKGLATRAEATTIISRALEWNK